MEKSAFGVVHKSLVPKGVSPRAGKFISANKLTSQEKQGMSLRLKRTARFRRLDEKAGRGRKLP